MTWRKMFYWSRRRQTYKLTLVCMYVRMYVCTYVTQVINSLPQETIINILEADPTLQEVSDAFSQVNKGKAPGLDGITVELLLAGGDKGCQCHSSVHYEKLAWSANSPGLDR